MAGGLYQRVAGRGFPSSVADGYTGAGALDSQGHPVNPAHGQHTVTDYATTVPGYAAEPAVQPAPGSVILIGAHGLPGGALDDHTPRTHAAPVPGWAGSYGDDADLYQVHENSAGIHAADFGALVRHTHTSARPEPEFDVWASNDPGQSALQPVTGQLRAMGGGDIDQGYSRSNGYGFDAGHRERVTATDGGQPMAYLDPAERLFVVPQAGGSFIPTDAVQGPGPYGSFLNGAAINATPATTYEPGTDPNAAPAAPAGAPASAGWW